jgi:hypothetical protein
MRPSRTRIEATAFAILAVGLVPLAWHLQNTVIIAIGGAVAGVVALSIHDRWNAVKSIIRTRPVLSIGSIAVASIVAVFAVRYLEILEELAYAPPWAAANAGRFQFYVVAFREELPLLWPLLPLSAALAVATPHHRRLALFCLAVVASTLVVHSIAAQKAMRYVYYIIPWICVVWGCAVASIIAQLADSPTDTTQSQSRYRLAPLAMLTLLGVGFAFSHEGTRVANLALGRLAAIDNLPFADEPEWSTVAAELSQLGLGADRLIVSNSVKGIFYLGRYDYELSATIVPETATGEEFGLDGRTGGRAIGTAASVAEVLSLPGTSFVVLEKAKLGTASGVVPEALDVITSRCSEVQLPPAEVRAWHCVTP